MKPFHVHQPAPAKPGNWLKQYYFARAAFSIVWVAAVYAIGKHNASAAALLFLIYPLWDTVANVVDARRSGGLRSNPTQALGAAVSLVTTVGVGLALRDGMNAALVVFGVWASLSGVLQLATGARRWKRVGAQWAMILSGMQSALAGAHFIQRGVEAHPYDVTVIAPYAAFGAFYFLVSGVWLIVSDRRAQPAAGAAR